MDIWMENRWNFMRESDKQNFHEIQPLSSYSKNYMK